MLARVHALGDLLGLAATIVGLVVSLALVGGFLGYLALLVELALRGAL